MIKRAASDAMQSWRIYATGGLIGLISFVALAPAVDVGVDKVREAYDLYSPVATVLVERVPSDTGEARVTMRVTKYRDCDLLTVHAYESRSFGWQKINVSKITENPIHIVPPGMTVRGDVWRIWPVSTGALRLSMVYDCNGRTVRLPVDVA